MNANTLDLKERFDAKWTPEPFSGCWLWTACVSGKNYGQLPYGKEQQAHRVSWLLHRGEIPAGLCVCHKCDTPLCVNPDHLFLATQPENVADAARKRRMRGVPGNRHSAKLSTREVLAVREMPGIQREIAKAFKISQQTVSLIKQRKAWDDL